MGRYWATFVSPAALSDDLIRRGFERNAVFRCRVVAWRRFDRRPMIPCRACGQDIADACATLITGYARPPADPNGDPVAVIHPIQPARCPHCRTPFVRPQPVQNGPLTIPNRRVWRPQ